MRRAGVLTQKHGHEGTGHKGMGFRYAYLSVGLKKLFPIMEISSTIKTFNLPSRHRAVFNFLLVIVELCVFGCSINAEWTAFSLIINTALPVGANLSTLISSGFWLGSELKYLTNAWQIAFITHVFPTPVLLLEKAVQWFCFCFDPVQYMVKEFLLSFIQSCY